MTLEERIADAVGKWMIGDTEGRDPAAAVLAMLRDAPPEQVATACGMNLCAFMAVDGHLYERRGDATDMALYRFVRGTDKEPQG